MSDSNEVRSIETLTRRGAFWKIVSQAVAQSSRLIFTFALAHLLTPSEYGIAGMALIVSGLVLAFSDLALGSALVQRSAITEDDRSTVFWTSIGTGVALMLVGFALAKPVAAFFGEPEVAGLFAAMSVGFVVAALGATQRAILTREMDFKRLELRVMLGTIIGGIVGVTAAALDAGPWAIIGQQLTILVVSTVVLWFATPWRPHFVFSVASIRELGGYSLNVLGTRLVFYVRENASTLIIGRALGAAALGVFTIAYNIVRLPATSIAVPLGDVLFPAFSRLQGDRERIATLWLRALPTMAALCMPALVGLAIVADDFVDVLLGDQWAAAAPVIQILAVVGILSCLDAWNPAILLALDKSRALLVITILAFAGSIAAILAGLPWGVNGVATATLLIAVLFQPPYFWYVGRLVGVTGTAVLRSLTGVIQATLGMGVAVLVTRIALVEYGVPPIVRLLVLAIVGLATLVGMLRVCDRGVLDEVARVLPGRRGNTDATRMATP
jgi:O-antigen/teichoic acid export membrane protein